MQPIKTILTILVGDYKGTILVKFGQITPLAVQENKSFEDLFIKFNVKL